MVKYHQEYKNKPLGRNVMHMPIYHRVSKSIAIMSVAVLGLSACMSDFANNKPKIDNPLTGIKLTESLGNIESQNLGAQFVKVALEDLEDGDFISAQKGFNRALKFEPTNSQLHFLNGLTYHLRTAAGDSSQKEYAAIGYRMALQHDASNYWAAYQLGHINFSDRRYREAQDAFAYGLLFAPEDPVLLKALAAASYYAQDLDSAVSAITQAEKVSPDDPKVLRMAAMFNAAGGGIDLAKSYLKRYRTTDHREADRLGHRIMDWQGFHIRKASVQLAQSASDILSGDSPAPSVSSDDSSDSSSDSTSNSTSDSSSSDNASISNTPSTPRKRMAMVDVVIIRSEERNVTDKGVNLLSGLTAALAGTSFSFTGTRTANDGSTGPNSNVNSFAYAPTLSVAANYSLNIFNDNNDHNEVLARPSLVALDGMQSEFFTGAVFHVQLTGTAGSEGTVSDVPIGIKLTVTPTFTGVDRVQLNVTASRAFIESRSSQISFSNFAQTSKNNVTANVELRFGDTLVLSGLSEKETEQLNDGVPILQDIPGLQYLFSHEDTLDYTKSVLILLTPRQPRYVHEDGSPKVDHENPADAGIKQPNLDELKGRPDWFRPASNLDAVFDHLKEGRLFKEFRSGDVKLETWVEGASLGTNIRRAVNFIYY